MVPITTEKVLSYNIIFGHTELEVRVGRKHTSLRFQEHVHKNPPFNAESISVLAESIKHFGRTGSVLP